MRLSLNRRSGIPLRHQIVSQVELLILSGELPVGARLPSVRALARRARVDPRTVHAAYRQLQANENLLLRPGSGVFVGRGIPRTEALDGPDRFDFDGALVTALRAGLSAAQVREAVRRWLDTPPPDRAVVVDTARETAEVLVAELRESLSCPLEAATFEDVARDAGRLDGAIAVTLPFHAARLRALAPRASVAPVPLEFSPRAADLDTVPAGGLVLVVSHSPRVVRYASDLVEGRRGHDVSVSCCLLSSPGWTRVLRSADLVLADVLALPVLKGARTSTRELRLLGWDAAASIRERMLLPPARWP